MSELIFAMQEDITVFLGRVTELQFTFYDEDDAVIDMSGNTFQCQIRETEEHDSELVATPTIDDSSASTGTITLTIDDTARAITQASGLKGFYDISVVDALSKPRSYVFGYAVLKNMPTVIV